VKQASKYTLGENGSVSSISAYFGSTSTLTRLVIYADSAGAPGSFLGVTEEKAAPTTSNVNEWLSFLLPSPLNLGAGDYWLGFWCSTSAFPFFYYDLDGARAYNVNTYSSSGTPSDPFGTPTTDAVGYSIYASYNISALNVPASSKVQYTG
jgi:hypothetical protein